MEGRGKASKLPKKKEEKWDTGDLDEKDAELFKHLPYAKEVGEHSKAKAKRKRTPSCNFRFPYF